MKKIDWYLIIINLIKLLFLIFIGFIIYKAAYFKGYDDGWNDLFILQNNKIFLQEDKIKEI